MPWHAHYRPTAVALGTIGLYAIVLVGGTAALAGSIGSAGVVPHPHRLGRGLLPVPGPRRARPAVTAPPSVGSTWSPVARWPWRPEHPVDGPARRTARAGVRVIGTLPCWARRWLSPTESTAFGGHRWPRHVGCCRVLRPPTGRSPWRRTSPGSAGWTPVDRPGTLVAPAPGQWSRGSRRRRVPHRQEAGHGQAGPGCPWWWSTPVRASRPAGRTEALRHPPPPPGARRGGAVARRRRSPRGGRPPPPGLGGRPEPRWPRPWPSDGRPACPILGGGCRSVRTGTSSGEASAVASLLDGGEARPQFSPVPMAHTGTVGPTHRGQQCRDHGPRRLCSSTGADRRGGPVQSRRLRDRVCSPWSERWPSPGHVVELVGRATLGELLAHAGLTGPPAAVSMGGYAGTWIDGRTAWRSPLDGPGLAAVGAQLGCGLIGVLPQGSCGLAETARLVDYLAGETAGQCGPCVHGTPAAGPGRSRPSPPVPSGLAGLRRLGSLADTVDGGGACSHPDGAVRSGPVGPGASSSPMSRPTWRGRPCSGAGGPCGAAGARRSTRRPGSGRDRPVRIDPIRCRGHAICALLFSDGLELDEWGFGRVVGTEPRRGTGPSAVRYGPRPPVPTTPSWSPATTSHGPPSAGQGR